MNIVILSGRITADPDVRITGSGKKMCQFSLAVDAGKDADGQRQTQFHDCVTWNNGAEFIERYVKKGNRILVQGRLDKSSYVKDGQKHYSVKVIADRVEFADGANQPRNEGKPMPTQKAPESPKNEWNAGLEFTEEDLPF